ncbi:MAG TPA: DUF523 and DUF1722 domain-containing protein [Burkholderiales bacterium]|nr:DUF523 and DUF1722 domain-containing protein [Burkholderiales bacterium]
MSTRPIRIGISACLLGEKVRYDGGHKRDAYAVRTLARHVELLPVCPEVAIGLGVPRAPIHLVLRDGAVRAVGVADPARDVTDALAGYGRRISRSLEDISGYVFKRRSPSCGLHDVAVEGGTRAGRGIYADAVLQALAPLPSADEADLADAARRDNFLERVFAFRRWQALVATGVTTAGLVQFHAAHKLALMAHSPRSVSELGRLVAHADPVERVAGDYIVRFMQTLSRPATAARHENALLHMLGYLKKRLDRADKAEMLDVIRRYRAQRVPRAAVLKLLRRHFKRHPDVYISRQTYLYPSTEEKTLRRL